MMKEKKSYYRVYDNESDRETVINLKLRDSDIKEIKASTGTTPREALSFSVDYADRLWVVIHEVKIEGLFGVQNNGAIWFLATDKFKEFAYSFAKESKKFLNRLLNIYPKLWNYVYKDHEESIKWLQWLGFAIENEERIKDFYYFYKIGTQGR